MMFEDESGRLRCPYHMDQLTYTLDSNPPKCGYCWDERMKAKQVEWRTLERRDRDGDWAVISWQEGKAGDVVRIREPDGTLTPGTWLMLGPADMSDPKAGFQAEECL